MHGSLHIVAGLVCYFFAFFLGSPVTFAATEWNGRSWSGVFAPISVQKNKIKRSRVKVDLFEQSNYGKLVGYVMPRQILASGFDEIREYNTVFPARAREYTGFFTGSDSGSSGRQVE
jgi:hypothetical protein